MIDVLSAVAALAVAGASGAVLLGAARADPDDDADRVVAMLAFGLGLWGIAGLSLAALHALRPAVVLGLATVAVVAGGPAFARALARACGSTGRPPAVVAATAGVTLVAMLVAVLAPAVTGDQTKYQLAYPKLYAEAGGLVATPWTFWGQQQFLQNFLFAVAYALRGERLALLLNFAWVPLAAAALARLVERHVGRGLGMGAAALLVTMPMAWSLATKAGSDAALVAYTVLAVAAVLDWREGDGRALRRAALAAGFAAGTKVMGLLTPGLLGVVVLVALPAARGMRARLAAAAVFGGIAAVVAAGPYVRNLVETGNPLHPFAASIFPSAHWSPEAGAYLDEYYRQYRAERAVRRDAAPYGGTEALRFPWDLTMTPESFERAARQSLDVGPFALAFVPAALVLATRAGRTTWLLGLGAAYVVVIAAGAWAHPRYVLPGWVLLLAAAMAGASALGRRWLAGAVAVTLVGHVIVTSRLALPGLPDQARAAAGVLSRAQYLERHSDRHRFWRRACPVIGSAGLVLVLEKIPHPYFIDCPFVLASYLEQQWIDYRALAAPADLAAASRRIGVTHVAVARPDLTRRADPFEARVARLWREWIERLGPPLVEQDRWALYALAPRVGR